MTTDNLVKTPSSHQRMFKISKRFLSWHITVKKLEIHANLIFTDSSQENCNSNECFERVS